MPGIWETHMKFSQWSRSLVKTIAVVLALALPTALAISSADARVGGGVSSGSRGSRTFSAPPSTTTAPGSTSQFNRTYSQPGAGMNTAAPARGGLFGRGGGFLGGLAAGFLGAGLLGMLFGGGLFGGLGGLSSILGLIIQIVLVVFVVRLAMSWWQRRNAPQAAYAGADGGAGPGAQASYRSGLGSGLGGGFGFGANNAPLEIKPDDYEAFERLLGDIQAAWSNEDVAKLHTLATPEMVSYFEKDLAENRARNAVNKVTNVKLLQGDLAEAWREGETDYATVAMRFALTDKTVDRNTGAIVAGSEQPGEVTEVWTFARRPGSPWELSAIQQTN
ncbi:Tim44 domain-containing protein [Bradyrhizobium manausense]|uniref:Tim44 domain-containing protein n=1 Tax=Bradyrhizobium manausense TaxID=989370 RepID=UPI001BA95660|nr:Tim44 domain-containing protein [Bradyrhizobium manausense]MBR0690526.1 Tim44 domain-containing protein [Bradyrhizobium manausense]MBR0722103.1 Tim44 domain-containing protein [Bradyrhizobium manausense]MBR0838387.1 Tim44 domain-containing protein [Bradyrhizobium manausense]